MTKALQIVQIKRFKSDQFFKRFFLLQASLISPRPSHPPIIRRLEAVTHEEGDALEQPGARVRNQAGQAGGPGPEGLVDVHREVLRQYDRNHAKLWSFVLFK